MNNVIVQHYRKEIPEIVERLVAVCEGEECFYHTGPDPIPSREIIVKIIYQVRRILFPGYFNPTKIDRINLRYHIGQEVVSLFKALSQQIAICMLHDSAKHRTQSFDCEKYGQTEALKFIEELPNIRHLLAQDVQAAYDGDPAAAGYEEIILCYPGLLATTVQRMAHQLHRQKISLIPRIMSEYVHGLTGIDLHPGAEIGGSFFIDHGVGVVIGETALIGKHVRIYQGVTLGALSLPKDQVEKLRGKKRHPTIKDNVIIYAGATILGGETVIGANCVIGGNVWITESVPDNTSVFIKKPQLVMDGPVNIKAG